MSPYISFKLLSPIKEPHTPKALANAYKTGSEALSRAIEVLTKDELLTICKSKPAFQSQVKTALLGQNEQKTSMRLGSAEHDGYWATQDSKEIAQNVIAHGKKVLLEPVLKPMITKALREAHTTDSFLSNLQSRASQIKPEKSEIIRLFINDLADTIRALDLRKSKITYTRDSVQTAIQRGIASNTSVKR
jgi:hypothetical protein